MRCSRLKSPARPRALAHKKTRLDALSLFVLAILAGAFIGFGAMLATTVLAGADGVLPFGVGRLLAGLVFCLAVWLSLGARSTGDKILAVVFPVSAFVAAGFEHSVANMYLVPLGLFVKMWGPASLWTQVPGGEMAYAALTWTGFWLNLVPVTTGNIIGGGGLVGAVYWFV